ncbi:MAG: hypothetical protein ACRDV7_13370, partial [Acidimicrobiia bacterium]
GVIDLDQAETFGELIVRPLAAGERVALDLMSLDEWGEPSDREAGIPRSSEAWPERPGAEGAMSGERDETDTRVAEPVEEQVAP